VIDMEWLAGAVHAQRAQQRLLDQARSDRPAQIDRRRQRTARGWAQRPRPVLGVRRALSGALIGLGRAVAPRPPAQRPACTPTP
jgi:hypothetical protein